MTQPLPTANVSPARWRAIQSAWRLVNQALGHAANGKRHPCPGIVDAATDTLAEAIRLGEVTFD